MNTEPEPWMVETMGMEYEEGRSRQSKPIHKEPLVAVEQENRSLNK